MMQAQIVANLLEATISRKGCDGVHPRGKTLKGQPGGQTNHVLLSHARVDEAWTAVGLKLFQSVETQVSCEKHRFGVTRHDVLQRLGKINAHRRAPFLLAGVALRQSATALL